MRSFRRSVWSNADVSKQEGRTVLFVSPNMGAWQVCVLALCGWMAVKIQRLGWLEMSFMIILAKEELKIAGNWSWSLLTRQWWRTPEARIIGVALQCALQHGELCVPEFDSVSKAPLRIDRWIGLFHDRGGANVELRHRFPDGHRPSLSEAGSYSLRVEVDALRWPPESIHWILGCRSGDSYSLDYLPAADSSRDIPGPKTRRLYCSVRRRGAPA